MDDFEHEFATDFRTLDELQTGDCNAEASAVIDDREPPSKRAKPLLSYQPNVVVLPPLKFRSFEDTTSDSDFSIPSRNLEHTRSPPPKMDMLADETIARIQRARTEVEKSKFADSMSSFSQGSLPQLCALKGQPMRRPPLRKKWVAVTATDLSCRLYFVVREERELSLNPQALSFSRLSLLSQRFCDLKAEAELAINRRILHTASAAVAISAGADAENSFTRLETVMKRKSAETAGLWVDKYKPNYYTDLLSDEGINRTLLTWLKLWDECVFGRKNVVAAQERLAHKRSFDHATQNKPHGKFLNPDELPRELDQHKRPINRVAILSGSPGYGKTTLAHTVARHCGYFAEELNASDDRTLEKFQKKIESATQMRSTLDNDPRPNCLIIDEIDGAPAASINYLVTLLKDGGSGKRNVVIKRPIICICNDLYVPALRDLRKIALVISFPSTESQKLSNRLSKICVREKLTADHNTLLALCEKTENDIRSCINTLQFVKITECCNELSMAQVNASSIGQKDYQKSSFTILREIFSIPRLKRNQRMENSTTFAARFNFCLNLVHSCDDRDKLRQALFDNYLNAKIRDSKMDSFAYGIDWFLFTERLVELSHEIQAFELFAYASYLPAVFHLLFANTNYTPFNTGNSQIEVTVKRNKCTSILEGFMADMSTDSLVYLDSLSVVLDFLPILLVLLVPAIRPVSSHLYNLKEREDLRALIATMIHYNLTYRQQRSDDGQYSFVLEPDIESVVLFSGQKPKRLLAYATKQMIAREIELEKVRRSEGSQLRNGVAEQSRAAVETSNAFSAKPRSIGAQPARRSEANISKLPNHLQQTLKPKAIPIAEEKKVMRDFFGRPIALSATASKSESSNKSGGGQQMTGVYFRYKEGSINAVRRNIRMKDLL